MKAKFIFMCMVTLTTHYLFSSENTMEFHSQYGQDKYLYETFFKETKGGVFVDIGAHDGIVLSNSYFFEKEMDWTGICVEPAPDSFRLLQENRSATCIEGCICSDRDTAQFFYAKGSLSMLSGILDKYSPRHLHRVKRELKESNQSPEMITVKCYDLTKLLIENDIYHVDYLSIDTEGGELEILKSIDFDRIDIKTISVENNTRKNRFAFYLKTVGFRRVAILDCDEIYINTKYL